jgi:hypothetical protein
MLRVSSRKYPPAQLAIIASNAKMYEILYSPKEWRQERMSELVEEKREEIHHLEKDDGKS